MIRKLKLESNISLRQVYKDIELSKNKLIKLARQKGSVWENFGQNEVRKLKDKYIDISDYSSKMNSIRDAIDSFDNWCMTYTLY